MEIKIAVATDDGEKIADHFDRAKYFIVFKIKNNKMFCESLRDNFKKSDGNCGSCSYTIMINNLRDCEMVISHSMGKKIYNDLLLNMIKPIITGEVYVRKAVEKHIAKNLKNGIDKLH